MSNFVSGGVPSQKGTAQRPWCERIYKEFLSINNKLIIQGVITKRKHVPTCQDSEYVTSTYNIMNKTLEELFYSKHTLKGKKFRAEIAVSSNNIGAQNQV